RGRRAWRAYGASPPFRAISMFLSWSTLRWLRPDARRPSRQRILGGTLSCNRWPKNDRVGQYECQPEVDLSPRWASMPTGQIEQGLWKLFFDSHSNCQRFRQFPENRCRKAEELKRPRIRAQIIYS